MQPPGRIVTYPFPGKNIKVDPGHNREFAFINDGKSHRYYIDGKLVIFNEFGELLNHLSPKKI